MTLAMLVAFLVLAWTSGSVVAWRQTDLDAVSDIKVIALNKGISVPFGRTVAVDPERHLKIAVRASDRCVVRVVQNDPLSQTPGRLSPSEFRCRFAPGEVHYTHFGSRNVAQDHVRLLLRYDSADDALVVPFSLRVRVLFDQQDIVTKNLPLAVNKLKGSSGPVDGRVLQLSYDAGREECRLMVIEEPGIALPKYGELTDFDLSEDEKGMVDCGQFLQKNVRYRHTADGNSPNRDYVPFMVELRDREGNELKQEYFQLTVRIKQAKENTPPRVTDDSLLLLDVNQFVMTPITLAILNAEDAETPSGELVFNITSFLGPSEGQIVSTDDRNMPIASFTQKDIEDLKIAYKPPPADSDVRRLFTISMEVVDSEGIASQSFTLLVTVNPTNTLAPVVVRNTGISLLEGQSRRLHSPKNLEISDEDDLDDVVVTVADGLRYGRLLLIDKPVKQFSPADLDAGLIRYQHDGSDTYADNIVFHMTDGEHNVQFLFPVTIFPEDDEPPILTVNTGLTLQKNSEADITPFVLSATDVDSDDDAIRFVMVEPGPLYGEVLLRQFPPLPADAAVADVDVESEWTVQHEGPYDLPTKEWTQQHINEGLVYYRHLGQHHAQTVMDAITFRLTDDSEPPNISKDKQFLVKILPLDDVPPERHPAATLHLIVDEFQQTEFTRGSLLYTDGDSDDRLLRYTIMAPPRDLDPNSHSDAGRIVQSDNPDAELTSFTQHQVNHHKVAYRPPPVELGLTPRMIQFEFQVEDEAGNVLPEQVFTVSLRPVDNKPPSVFNSGFRVFENGFANITTAVLDATDPDTDSHHLAFRLVEQPLYGVLQLHHRNMNVGDVFRREDLMGEVLAYANGGAEQKRDQFKVEVSDGAHRVPATVHVTIRPVEDEAPKWLTSASGMLGIVLECREGKSRVIDSDALRVSDERRLTFLMDVAPRLGELQVDGRRSNRFTQEQLRKGLVRYQHRGREIGRRAVRDSFNLTVSDKSDVDNSRVRQIQVNVTIEPVDNTPPNVTLGAAYSIPEGSKKPIGVEFLRVTDVDSEEEDVVCTVLTQSAQGYVENVAPIAGSERPRVGIPVSAFSVVDVRHGTVNYVQSIHWGSEPRDDRLVLQCSDGVNQSPRVVFPITITPTNDERPQMLVGNFSGLEGMLLHIDQTVLDAVDADQPTDELTFRVAKRPQHGKIVVHSPDGVTQVDRFDVKQLRGDGEGPMVAYYHDDSETLRDEFELVLTDGNPQHANRQTIAVTITPMDDETPRLTVNNGLDVDVSETKVITSRLLKAEDLDSKDADLVYAIRAAPRHGRLIRIDPATGQHLQNITKGQNFTQEDLDRHSIAYVHLGQDGGRDLIKFDVTDGYNPLIDQYFHITVQSADVIHPHVVNRGVELPEGGRVTLTTDILSTSDLDSADEDLVFTVTRAPSKGHLENVDQPDVPIAMFTQLDLAGSKIAYVHTSADEVKMDSFEFEVSDGFNSIYRTFRISLSDVDNKKPILFVDKLTVSEGGHRIVTPFELKIEDHDTPENNLRFNLVRGPLHGTLKYNRTQSISAFTMANIDDNLISYHHDGSETLKDSFTFIVTDGTHDRYFVYPDTTRETRLPQTMAIEILPVDNGTPHLVVNRGATTIGPLDNGVNGVLGFQLSNKVLKAQDRDSPDSELLYVITTSPKHGFLCNRTFNNVSITNFTQVNIHFMDILDYIEYTNGSSRRCLSQGEDVQRAGHVLECAIAEISGETLSVLALVVQSSAISAVPHEVHVKICQRLVKDAKCSCKAGAGKKCKHIVAVLLQLVLLHEVPILSPTEKEQCWGKRNVNIAKQMYQPRPVTSLPCCPKIQVKCYKTKDGALSRLLKSVPYTCPATANLSPVIPVNTNTTQVNASGCGSLLKSIPPIEVLRTLPEGVDITEELQKIYVPMVISCIETATRNKRSCWLKFKPGLITASFAHKVFTRLIKLTLEHITAADVKGLLTEILQVNRFQTKAMKHGIEQEDVGCSKYIAYMKSNGHDVKLQKTGLFLYKNFPMIGCTPDRLVTFCCQCCIGKKRLLEVKSPQVLENSLVIKKFNENHIPTPKPAYVTQMEVQMGVTAIKECDFFAHCDSKIFHTTVCFDEELFARFVHLVRQFYNMFLFKYIRAM